MSSPSQSLTNKDRKNIMEDVCIFLEDVTRPRKKQRILSVDSYIDRLRTFTSSNYFAKPIFVSPIVCAARGWFCIQPDIVECSYCHAKLAILFDPKFNPIQQETMAENYYEKLAREGHNSESCLFYERQQTEEICSIIPYYLSSTAFDIDLVQLLLDHSNPLKVLKREHIPYLVKNVKTSTPRYPILPRLPNTLNKEDLDLVQKVLEKMGDSSNPKASRLALFGWTKGTCRLCLATLSTNTTKKLSWTSHNNNDVLLSGHNYYCPYLCGIPIPSMNDDEEKKISITDPFWKIICQRVLSTTMAKEKSNITTTIYEEQETSVEGSWKRIKSMLKDL